MAKPHPRFLLSAKSAAANQGSDFYCDVNDYWTISGDTPNQVVNLNQLKLLIYGDLINPEIIPFLKGDWQEWLSLAKGHFIAILIESNTISIATSYFSFLPVYYNQQKREVSNSWEVIRKGSLHEVDELFILESHLFNYPIGDVTLYTDVKVLDSFTLLSLEKDALSFKTIQNLKDWFPSKVDKNVSLSILANQFIASCQGYFNHEKELITFTSGFDGRTILATALACGKSVQTFSMGRMENDDVYNPMSNARELKIPFDAIDLCSEVYLSSFFNSAVRMSSKSGGRNGFLYPHFYYCAQHYQTHAVLHTGYCGSELFRALHIAGAVTSKEMVSIFLEEDEESLFRLISNSPRLQLLNEALVERQLPNLMKKIRDIRSLKCQFDNDNHFFYYFIFKEVFRKVFGFWAQTQFENIKVRTPFLDFEFVRLLLKSHYAGCNNEFFTHNPLKRYKGQLLYAQILKSLNSPLFKMMTGKNYRPSQLLSLKGQLSIVFPYIRKKWNKKIRIPNTDNLALITGFLQGVKGIKEVLPNVEAYYSLDRVNHAIEKMNPLMAEVERDMIFQIASLSLTLKDEEASSAN
jgi:asparagine synthase (glutamine-hydrolysing)